MLQSIIAAVVKQITNALALCSPPAEPDACCMHLCTARMILKQLQEGIAAAGLRRLLQSFLDNVLLSAKALPLHKIHRLQGSVRLQIFCTRHVAGKGVAVKATACFRVQPVPDFCASVQCFNEYWRAASLPNTRSTAPEVVFDKQLLLLCKG